VKNGQGDTIYLSRIRRNASTIDYEERLTEVISSCIKHSPSVVLPLHSYRLMKQFPILPSRPFRTHYSSRRIKHYSSRTSRYRCQIIKSGRISQSELWASDHDSSRLINIYGWTMDQNIHLVWVNTAHRPPDGITDLHRG
jgi:hypothetical protein